MLAVALKDPMWTLDESEAKKLAEAVGKVQAQYGLNLDPKTQAWLHLIGVAGSVYGTRVGTIMLMRGAEKARRMAAPKPPETEDDQVNKVIPLNGSPADKNGSFRAGFAPVPGYQGPTNPSEIYPPGWRGATS